MAYDTRSVGYAQFPVPRRGNATSVRTTILVATIAILGVGALIATISNRVLGAGAPPGARQDRRGLT